MTGFMVWRLVIDLGFLGSIIFFCFKYAKLSTLSQVESVVELEGSLRRLMQEAQVSGAQLSDVLVKRQTAIEKLMLDMQALEQRVKRLATAAELQVTAPTTKTNTDLEVRERNQAIQPTPIAPLASQVVAEVVRESQPQTQAVTETPSSSASNLIVTAPEQSLPAAAASSSAAKQYNIFGEEIISKPSTQPAPPPQLSAILSRLANKVEREVVPEMPTQPKKVAPYEDASSPAKDIQKVYSAAEELLKTGKEVEYVAFRTKLPVGDVQMLATMLEREQEVPPPEPMSEVNAISDDPRLGVLGSIKRQVQTL